MTEPVRFIAHDSNGHVIRGTMEDFITGEGFFTCRCGRTAPARRLDVQVVKSTACGARCLEATGLVCRCSCAGRRHGAGLSG